MKRLILGILVAFSVVSVSMGAYISEENEANYQKLKAEMEEVESNEYWDGTKVTCSWGEDGEVVIGGRGRRNIFAKDWCGLKNVLAFVDEYRANKGKGGIYTYYEVEKMPRFKEDSGIYGWKSIERLLENALEKWKEVKLKIVMEKNGI